MDLQTWCAAERGRASQLADAIGVLPSFVSQMVGRTRPIPAEHCPSIERFTSGAVRCEEMRPDVEWHVLRGGAPGKVAAVVPVVPVVPEPTAA